MAIKQIPDGLQFQMKVECIDLNGNTIPLSKLKNFKFDYFVGTSSIFVAQKETSESNVVTYTNCSVQGNFVFVTINSAFGQKGILRNIMTLEVIDDILPDGSYIFTCPEQKTNVEII